MIPSSPLIVLDTNILVSALISTGGLPARIIGLVKSRSVQTRYSDAILAEYGTVLSRPKFNFHAEDVQALIAGIIRTGIPADTTPSAVSMADESDRKFYDAAKNSGADLITGNVKHYPDEPFVLTPAFFFQKYCFVA